MATKTKAKKTAKKTTSKMKAAVSKAKPAAAAPKKSSPLSATNKMRTKSEITSTLAEQSGVSKKEVSHVLETLSKMIELDLGKKGPGMFTVPGLMKITIKKKPATKARTGVNPFTGEEMTFKAKPARNVVKIRPLKALKDMV